MIRTHLASNGRLQVWHGPDEADYPVPGVIVTRTRIAVGRDRSMQLAAIEERRRAYNRKLEAAIAAEKKMRLYIELMSRRGGDREPDTLRQ
jgi:hypothetical protein